MRTPQPITAAPRPEQTFGFQAALGAGVVLNGADPLDPDGRWTDGYILEGKGCGEVKVGSPSYCTPGAEEPSPPAEFGWGDFPGFHNQTAAGYPIFVEGGVECQKMGTSNELSVWKQLALDQLEACRWKAIAHELWTGDVAKAKLAAGDENYEFNKYLASEDATVLAGGDPVSPTHALSLLAAAFGGCTCGAGRVVHMPMALVPFVRAKGVVLATGQRLSTVTGESVVTDDGYTGSGPDGEDPPAGMGWVYGTTTITARLDATIHYPNSAGWEDAMRVRDNKVIARAQQLAMASWLCCHFAVLVNFAGPGSDEDNEGMVI